MRERDLRENRELKSEREREREEKEFENEKR